MATSHCDSYTCNAFWNTATCSLPIIASWKEWFPVWAWLCCHLNQGALNAASKLLRIFDILIPFDKQITKEHPRPISFTTYMHITAATDWLRIFTESLTSEVCNKGIYGCHTSSAAGCLALAFYMFVFFFGFFLPWLLWRSSVTATTPNSINKAAMMLPSDKKRIVIVRALPCGWHLWFLTMSDISLDLQS